MLGNPLHARWDWNQTIYLKLGKLDFWNFMGYPSFPMFISSHIYTYILFSLHGKFVPHQLKQILHELRLNSKISKTWKTGLLKVYTFSDFLDVNFNRTSWGLDLIWHKLKWSVKTSLSDPLWTTLYPDWTKLIYCVQNVSIVKEITAIAVEFIQEWHVQLRFSLTHKIGNIRQKNQQNVTSSAARRSLNCLSFMHHLIFELGCFS